MNWKICEVRGNNVDGPDLKHRSNHLAVLMYSGVVAAGKEVSMKNLQKPTDLKKISSEMLARN